jgi:hypothetical protein
MARVLAYTSPARGHLYPVTPILDELRWGTAHLVAEDDPRQRQRQISRGKPGRALNAFVVRTLGTSLLTVRIDLDPPERAS